MRRLTISFLFICLWAGSLRLSGAPAWPAAGISWVVEVEYPSVSPSPEETTTIRWRFTASGQIQQADGCWWNIQVRDEEGITPVTGSFLFDPDRGLIRAVTIRELIRGDWKERRMTGETDRSVCLGDFPPLPLDFVGRDVRNSSSPATIPTSRQRITKTSGSSSFLEEYELKADHVREQGGQVPGLPGIESGGRTVLRLQVRDVHHPGSDWVFVWAEDFPWWLECRGPAWSARLIGIGQ